MNVRELLTAVMMGSVSLGTAACMYEPDNFTTSRVQVEQKPFSETVPVSEFSSQAVASAAAQYRKHGDGPLELVVTYDPKSKTANAMAAADEAAKIAKMFRQNGVAEVRTSIMPVVDNGDGMRALYSYDSYNALAPKDCDLMPGIDTRHVEAEKDYKLGCSVETMYARQIARPKDLKGQGPATEPGDGRRAANIVDVYRTGVPNEPLEGEKASGD